MFLMENPITEFEPVSFSPGVWRALDEHGGDAVAARGARVGHLEALLLPLAVLPLRLLVQLQLVLARLVLLLLDAVGGVGRHEGQLGGDARRAGRAAQQAAQVRQRQAHPAHGGGGRGGGEAEGL